MAPSIKITIEHTASTKQFLKWWQACFFKKTTISLRKTYFPKEIPISLREIPISLRKIPISLRKLPISLRKIPISLRKIPISLRKIQTSLRKSKISYQRGYHFSELTQGSRKLVQSLASMLRVVDLWNPYSFRGGGVPSIVLSKIPHLP